MGNWGNFSYESFKKMAKQFDKALAERMVESTITAILKEAAMRGLAKVKKRTPVGSYDGHVEFMANLPQKEVNFITKAGKQVSFTAKARTRQVKFDAKQRRVGGHLRRSWQVGTVKKQGNKFLVEIFNNVEYASYVEYGHRTRNSKSWVEGKFMLTISLKEVETLLPGIADKHSKQLLLRLLNE